jgi:AcrR family transcriptional regulator
VRDITAKAGYNRSTFYEYFVDVCEVLEQLENSLLPELSEIPPLDIANKSQEALTAYMQLFQKHSEYYRVLLGERGDARFAAKLKSGVKERLRSTLPGAESTRLDYALEIVLSVMIGALVRWYDRGQDYPMEEMIRMIVGFMDHGLPGLVPEWTKRLS